MQATQATAAAAAALTAQDVRVTLGRRAVLSGASLAVAPGEVVGLIGPNGAGKSTLMRAVAGLQPMQGGAVTLGGALVEPKWGLARRARMGLGFIPQGSSTLRGLSVWENLKAVPGLSDAEAEAALSEVGLTDRADALAETLSGGERRRLEIGRALRLPGLVALLCDEPFAALDPPGVQAVSDLLRAAARRAVAVLVTDHQVRALLDLCGRLVALIDGHIHPIPDPRSPDASPWLARYLHTLP